MLSHEEALRLETMTHEKRRKSFLLGRVSLRLLLSEMTDTAPEAIRVTVEESGSLSAPETPYHISIAHSGERAVAVASRDRVGVDLEEFSDKDDDLLPYILHEVELPLIDRLPLERLEKLFLCWTVKEAVLKALGTGLRRSPKTVQITRVDPFLKSMAVHDTEGHAWHVWVERRDTYYLSLAVPDER